eukprot:PhF_6_TR15044/c0_g1_i1/m.23610
MSAKEILRGIFSSIVRDKPLIVTEADMMGMSRNTGRESLTMTIIPDTTAISAQAAWQEVVATDFRADRAVGCLVGGAIGDAVGHPLEFLPTNGQVETEDRPWVLKKRWEDAGTRWGCMRLTPTGTVEYPAEYNKFQLERGQWTDDFSMALCLADSLLVHPQYHGGDCRTRYHYWWHHGYNNAFRYDTDPQRTSCGLGGNIAKSLGEVGVYRGRPALEVPDLFSSANEDAGNGSIMRLGPVPVRFWNDDANGVRVAVLQSRGTHPGNDAAACCAFMTMFISQAIRRPEGEETMQAFIDRMVQDFIANPPYTDSGVEKLKLLLQCRPPGPTEACWDWKQPELKLEQTLKARGKKYNGYPVDEGYFGAYCMDGMAMSLWSMYRSKTFAETIANVVNLLGDADTTGAICGQMTGAFYGFKNIQNSKWSSHMYDNLKKWDPNSTIPLRATLLYLAGEFTS